jgi:hypothetical protein
MNLSHRYFVKVYNFKIINQMGGAPSQEELTKSLGVHLKELKDRIEGFRKTIEENNNLFIPIRHYFALK